MGRVLKIKTVDIAPMLDDYSGNRVAAFKEKQVLQLNNIPIANQSKNVEE